MVALAARSNDIVPLDWQYTAMASPEFELLAGGGRGPGKTYWLVALEVIAQLDALEPEDQGEWRGLILRRSMPQLREAMDMCAKVLPLYGAHWMATTKTWIFPSGATLELAFCETRSDLERYWGRSFHYIGVDELGHWLEAEYLWLFTILRSTNPRIRCFIRATANPIGRGHLWIKKRFVDAGPYGKPIWTPANDNGTRGHWRKYIHVVPADNPKLQPDYIDRLAQLPSDAMRRAFINGDWNTVEGVMFAGFNTAVHVVKSLVEYPSLGPYKLPPHWPRNRVGDPGFVNASCYLWYAEDDYGGLVFYRELWRTRVDVDHIADEINAIEAQAGEGRLNGPLDPQAWERLGTGTTIADRFARKGVRWFRAAKGPNSRALGCHEMHRRLAAFTPVRVGDSIVQVPAIRFMDVCRMSISTIPTLEPDPSNPEDVLGGGDDHAWDACKMALRHRPLRARDPGDGGRGERERLARQRATDNLRSGGSRSRITGY